jgi:hypothetical protein
MDNAYPEGIFLIGGRRPPGGDPVLALTDPDPTLTMNMDELVDLVSASACLRLGLTRVWS